MAVNVNNAPGAQGPVGAAPPSTPPMSRLIGAQSIPPVITGLLAAAIYGALLSVYVAYEVTFKWDALVQLEEQWGDAPYATALIALLALPGVAALLIASIAALRMPSRWLLALTGILLGGGALLIVVAFISAPSSAGLGLLLAIYALSLVVASIVAVGVSGRWDVWSKAAVVALAACGALVMMALALNGYLFMYIWVAILMAIAVFLVGWAWEVISRRS